MLKNLSKLRKKGNLILQLLIFAATCIFIYFQVFSKADFPGFIGVIKKISDEPGVPSQFRIILVLMLLNWCLEAVKWKFLIGKIEKIGFFKALQAVLAGISISSFTPNRTGEFIGRVFILKKSSVVEGILITLVGSMGQLLVTVVAGSASLLVFVMHYFTEAVFSHHYIFIGMTVLLVVFNLLLLGLYLNLSFLATLKERMLKNRLKKLRRFFRVFALYRKRELLMVLLLSLMRYAVFSTQFFLLLQVFDVRIPFLSALILISLTYFIMAVIPTVALTELGIRGSVALYFFGFFFDQPDVFEGTVKLGILAASTSLWLINIGLPALLGTIFIFRLQFFRARV